jgi:hypothetical protein
MEGVVKVMVCGCKLGLGVRGACLLSCEVRGMWMIGDGDGDGEGR